MGRYVAGRFEILILLSYEVADELGGGMAGGMWYPSERNRAERETAVVEEVGDGTY